MSGQGRSALPKSGDKKLKYVFFLLENHISTLIISNWHGERNMSVLNLIRRILSVMVPLCITGTSFVQKEKFYYFINVKLLTNPIPVISV